MLRRFFDVYTIYEKNRNKYLTWGGRLTPDINKAGNFVLLKFLILPFFVFVLNAVYGAPDTDSFNFRIKRVCMPYGGYIRGTIGGKDA